MTTELLAQIGGPLAGVGLAALVLAGHPVLRLAGLAAWAAGVGLLVPLLAPSNHDAELALVAAVGLVLAVALALLFRRWPWALAFLGLAAAAARIPVSIGDTSASLLVPLYAVVAGAALLLAWELLRDRPRARELGPIGWPLAALVGWLGLSLAWSTDAREGSIELLFFILPFGLLAVSIARLPWRRPPLVGLFGLLAIMALVFAAVGIAQWATRDVFWNPKVIVGNVYAPFYRVNSVFWDPSIYGRFLVVAILAALALLVLRLRPRLDLVLAVGIAGLWVGLLFSFSQSSFAALVAGIVVVAAVAWRWRAIAAIGLVAVVMIPIGAAAPQFREARDSLFAGSGATFDDATSGRSQLISNGIRIAADHPVVGVGVGSFKVAYAERLGLERRAPPKAASHTTPVTVTAETGLVGLAFFLWLVVGVFVTALRGVRGQPLARATGLVAALGIAAIFVHGLFYNAFLEDPMLWGVIGLAGLAFVHRDEEPA